MRRYYTPEAYLNLVEFIRGKIPKIALSSDFISGFCGESETQFEDTLNLIEKVGFDMAYLFAYSMRDKTHAYHNLDDNVPEEIKKKRLNKMIEKFRENVLKRNKFEINSYHLVLVEGKAKKMNLRERLAGRTDTNKLCIFSSIKVPKNIPEFLKFNLKGKDIEFFDRYNSFKINTDKGIEYQNFNNNENYFFQKYSSYEKNKLLDKNCNESELKINKFENEASKLIFELFNGDSLNSCENLLTDIKVGDYVIVKINDCSTNTLFGTPVCIVDKLTQFFEVSEGHPYFHLKKYDNCKIYNSNIFNHQNMEKELI